MHASSHQVLPGKFCCAWTTFSMKLLGFMSKAIKLLLTELVGQCRDILPSAISEYGKGWGQYIPALTNQLSQ